MDGDYYFGNLQIGGVYYLKELEASEGYVLRDGVFTVRVLDDGTVDVRDGVTEEALERGQDGRVLFTDEAEAVSGPRLPATGGMGLSRYYGYVLSLLACVCLICLQKRKHML